MIKSKYKISSRNNYKKQGLLFRQMLWRCLLAMALGLIVSFLWAVQQ